MTSILLLPFASLVTTLLISAFLWSLLRVRPLVTSRLLASIVTGLGCVFLACLGLPYQDDGYARMLLGVAGSFSLIASVGCWAACLFFWHQSKSKADSVGIGFSRN